MERRSNYDITRDRLERDFLQYDQEAMLRRVPLRHDADYLYLTFLRREYRIDRKTGRVEWSDDGFQTANHAGHDEVGTIFDYLCCADPSVPLTGEYVSVNQLDGVVTGTTLGNDMFEDWARQFTGKTAALAQACEALGGEKEPVWRRARSARSRQTERWVPARRRASAAWFRRFEAARRASFWRGTWSFRMRARRRLRSATRF